MTPNTMVYHFHKVKFDHRPLAIYFGKKRTAKPTNPFRFISAWLSHKDFRNIVTKSWEPADQLEDTVKGFIAVAKKWNMEVFGIIFQKKRILLAHIKGIQRRLEAYYSYKLSELENDLQTKLEAILDNEELLWKHKF